MSSAVGEVREAHPDDNPALLALAEACPMQGDIGLCVSRRPDFFALNRLEGERWQVGVVDGPDGIPVGCVAVARRHVFLNGRSVLAMYVSDLKVRPDHRGGVVADALSRWARDVCVATGGEDVPTFLAVLAGNRQMQRRLPGPRGLPRLHPVATVRSSAISLLWRRRRPDQGLRVAPAGPEDVEEMADLWRRVAPRRHLAHVHDARSLAGWVEAAPGLELSAYRLARRPDGRLAGFLGLWDQEPFKQLRVTSYSRRLAAARWAFNALAPSVRATPLPRPGRALRHVTAVHLCVPPEEPGVLRSLVLHAYDELRGRGYSFLLVGLDRSDPLAAALRGLLGQPTDVSLCLATPAGRDPPVLDARPIHHEIALV